MGHLSLAPVILGLPDAAGGAARPSPPSVYDDLAVDLLRQYLWLTTSAVVGGRKKAVVNSNQAGPPRLKTIEDAVEAPGRNEGRLDRNMATEVVE